MSNNRSGLHRLWVYWCDSPLLSDFSSVSVSPTIEGIFGKDWCMDLWKDRDPYSLERVPASPQSSEKVRGRFTEVITEQLTRVLKHM